MATEAQEQMTLVERAAYHPIAKKHLFAIPNGGSRHPKEAANLTKQGVMAGVADLFLAYPVLPYSGLFVELKRRLPTKGKVTDKQADFLNRMQCVGYATHIAYGYEDAWSVMMQYLDGNFEQEVTNGIRS